jgi:hypothetical protein
LALGATHQLSAFATNYPEGEKDWLGRRRQAWPAAPFERDWGFRPCAQNRHFEAQACPWDLAGPRRVLAGHDFVTYFVSDD